MRSLGKNLALLLLVAVGTSLLTPMIYSKTQRREDLSLTQQHEALKNIRFHMLKTLQPTDENERWLRVNPAQYNSLRNYQGYVVDLDDYLVGPNTTIRGAVKKIVKGNREIVSNFMRSYKRYEVIPHNLQSDIDFIRENFGYKDDYYLSEMQGITSDLPSAAFAAENQSEFYGINPRDYVYDSKGKMSYDEEVLFTYNYHNKYKEYWVDYFLNDDAHIYRRGGWELQYKYIR